MACTSVTFLLKCYPFGSYADPIKNNLASDLRFFKQTKVTIDMFGLIMGMSFGILALLFEGVLGVSCLRNIEILLWDQSWKQFWLFLSSTFRALEEKSLKRHQSSMRKSASKK